MNHYFFNLLRQHKLLGIFSRIMILLQLNIAPNIKFDKYADSSSRCYVSQHEKYYFKES